MMAVDAASAASAGSGLWHVLQFAAVGAAVAAALARDGVAYVPYAERAGLFKGYWAPFVPLIEDDWRPWLAGREEMAVALDRMVARLPAGL